MTLSPHILILAAGQGKRMVSQLPKVLHPVLFQPMLHHVIDLAMSVPHASLSVVIGHGGDQVEEACRSYAGLRFFRQREQLGTAHAVLSAKDFLAAQSGHVLILSGDVILLERASLERLLAAQAESGAQATLLSAELDNPHGYGRILRGTHSEVLGIREEKDCDPTERARREVNAGIYGFEIAALFDALGRVKSANRQNEFYLTDTIELLVREGGRVSAELLGDPSEMTGINDRAALSDVEGVLQHRINRAWMMKGVTLQRPESIFIDPRSVLEADVRIEAGCQILRSRIARGATIESGTRLIDATIGEGAHIKQGCYVEKSSVGPAAAVGPYAHLRPGSALAEKVKIGNFVEIKNSKFGPGSKASHLSYIGDAEIGKNVNLGCGFVTCNYDGVKKHVTVIEDNVFIGSDSQTVAPVRIGHGSYVASGTTVTEDVPPDSLALSRGKQITKKGYAAKYRKP